MNILYSSNRSINSLISNIDRYKKSGTNTNFQNEGKCAVWNWLTLSGSFIVKVPVSTSFDESSTLTVNYSMFTFSTNFVFSFPVK